MKREQECARDEEPPPPTTTSFQFKHPFYLCLGDQLGVLLGILGGGVPPGFPSPDPISDQKMSFFTPVSRPGL